MSTSFLLRDVLKKRKDQSAQYFYRLNQLFYRSINFSHFAYGDDLVLILTTKQYCCRSFTSLQLFHRNATQTSPSLSSNAVIFRCTVRTTPDES